MPILYGYNWQLSENVSKSVNSLLSKSYIKHNHLLVESIMHTMDSFWLGFNALLTFDEPAVFFTLLECFIISKEFSGSITTAFIEEVDWSIAKHTNTLFI